MYAILKLVLILGAILYCDGAAKRHGQKKRVSFRTSGARQLFLPDSHGPVTYPLHPNGYGYNPQPANAYGYNGVARNAYNPVSPYGPIGGADPFYNGQIIQYRQAIPDPGYGVHGMYPGLVNNYGLSSQQQYPPFGGNPYFPGFQGAPNPVPVYQSPPPSFSEYIKSSPTGQSNKPIPPSNH